jgi:uncharacterized protein YjbI with pentapeptide repeats
MALQVGADLSMARVNLSSADLRYVSFRGAQLNGALLFEPIFGNYLVNEPAYQV